MSESRHGTPYSYRKGCRCSECCAANTRSVKASRQRRTDRLATGEADSSQIRHGRSAYTNWGCRCAICTRDHTLAIQPAVDRWRRKNPQAVKAMAARWTKAHPEKAAEQVRKNTVKRQNATIERAHHHQQSWTGSEIELALRDDLSSREVALAIGRTLYAVRNFRHRMKAARPDT